MTTTDIAPILSTYANNNIVYGTLIGDKSTLKPGTYTMVEESEYKKLINDHTEYKNKIEQLTQNAQKLKKIIKSNRQSINTLRKNNKKTQQKISVSNKIELEIYNLKDDVKNLKENINTLMEHKDAHIWVETAAA